MDTELMNQAIERDLERHRAAVDPHERQRIMNRMIDTVMQATGCFQSQAAMTVVDMIRKAS